MIDEFFYVTQWANAYMYISCHLCSCQCVYPLLNKGFIIIIIIIIIINNTIIPKKQKLSNNIRPLKKVRVTYGVLQLRLIYMWSSIATPFFYSIDRPMTFLDLYTAIGCTHIFADDITSSVKAKDVKTVNSDQRIWCANNFNRMIVSADKMKSML